MAVTPPPEQELVPHYKITEADRQRIQSIEAAWRVYDDDFKKPLQVPPDQPDPNVLTNRISPIVDTIGDFLFGDDLTISVEESAPTGAQEILDTTWGRKETKIPLLLELQMSGSLAGQAFLRIVPNQDKKTYRLIVLDPATVFVQTVRGDCRTVQLYCIEYISVEMVEGKSQRVYFREEINRVDPQQNDPDSTTMMSDQDTTWIMQHWLRVGDRGKWLLAGDPIEWKYPFPPVFSCQNKTYPHNFWGRPNITKGIAALNDALNMALSLKMQTEKLYGHPILWATGVGESEIDIPLGRIIGLPSDDGKIASVPLNSDAGNYQLSGNLRADIDEISGVPAIATGRVAELPQGQISGVALELIFMPLIKLINRMRCLYGALIIDVSKAILWLSGMGEDLDITLGWQEILPHDMLALAQTALVKQQAGVSQTTTLREMGYDRDEEVELIKAEQEQQAISYSRGQGLPPEPELEEEVEEEEAQPAQPSRFLGRGGQ